MPGTNALKDSLDELIAQQVGAAGIDPFPAGAAAANGVSQAEVIRYIAETLLLVPGVDNVLNAMLTQIVGRKDDAAAVAIGTDKTLMAAVKGALSLQLAPTVDAATDTYLRDAHGRKTDAAVTVKGTTKTTVAMVKGLLDILGDIATFPAATAPANAVTHGAVLRYIAEKQGYRYVSKDVTYGVQGATNLFTVTGLVQMILLHECLTDLTSATDPTLEVGVAGNTAGLIAQLVSGVTLDAGELYVAATPAPLSIVALPAAKLVNAGTIIQTIGAADATGGTGRYHCFWLPVSSTGAVVAA